MQEFFESAMSTPTLQIDSDWILPHDSKNPSSFTGLSSNQATFSSPYDNIEVSAADLYNLPINL